MAITATTLSSAVVVADSSIVVASATGFAAGRLVRIDDEYMQIAQNYSSGTTIPVIRGRQGTKTEDHPSGALVRVGTAAEDFDAPGAWSNVSNPYGRIRRMSSISATGSLTLPNAGQDTVVQLNGTSVIALTVPVPTKEMDGDLLFIAANGVAAHTVTFTGGLSGAGSSYDVITINATAPVVLGPFMAVNGLWQACVAVPMAGTVTNVTATVA